MFEINANASLPIYRQVMEQVRRKVSSGQLQAGDTLPSVRSVAKVHAVNAMTISKAYSLLEAEGLLLRQRGRSMEIADSAPTETKRERLLRLDSAVDQLVLAAQQLELETDDVVRALRNRMASAETENPDV